MGKIIDLTGQKFGRLTVIKKSSNKTNSGQIKWICKCECGNIKEIAGQSLRNHLTQSCGCLQKEITSKRSFKDITNQRFGKLIALYPTDKKSGQNYIWHCICDCGNECEIREGDLVNHHTTSCGCIKKSIGEIKIIEILQKNNISFNYQHSFDNCKYLKTNKPVFFDFYLPKYNRIIEFDGIQHFQINGGWNNKENYKKTVEKDNFRNQYAKDNNIPLVRIPYWERDNITLEMILGDRYLI